MLYDCRQVQDAEMPSGDAMTLFVAVETAKVQTRPAEMPLGGKGSD